MYKTICYLSIIFSLILVSCKGNKSSNNTSNDQVISNAVSTSPEMSFDKNLHDFGTIQEGETVSTLFTFTNTGKSDLIIVDARGSCGCTVPEYPKNTPISPGESQTITVNFDSSNKPGIQQKSVTLSANTSSGREMLRIKANVTPDPVKQQQRDAQAKARQQN